MGSLLGLPVNLSSMITANSPCCNKYVTWLNILKKLIKLPVGIRQSYQDGGSLTVLWQGYAGVCLQLYH